jgi:hypothetical protein
MEKVQEGDCVVVTKDFPRVGLSKGDMVSVILCKSPDEVFKEDLFEVNFFSPTAKKMINLVVLGSWIEKRGEQK